jgi:hypothetical protein
VAGKKKQRSTLNAGETKFVACWEGNAAEAAHKAKYKNPKVMGARLMQRSQVKAAIKAKQASMVAESGKQLSKAIAITRNDIINRLDDLSQNAESDSTKVSALGHLIDIFGLSAKQKNDTDIFAGWTDEELEYYRETGKLPPSRDGSVMGKSHGDSGAAQPPAAKTH